MVVSVEKARFLAGVVQRLRAVGDVKGVEAEKGLVLVFPRKEVWWCDGLVSGRASVGSGFIVEAYAEMEDASLIAARLRDHRGVSRDEKTWSSLVGLAMRCLSRSMDVEARLAETVGLSLREVRNWRAGVGAPIVEEREGVCVWLAEEFSRLSLMEYLLSYRLQEPWSVFDGIRLLQHRRALHLGQPPVMEGLMENYLLSSMASVGADWRLVLHGVAQGMGCTPSHVVDRLGVDREFFCEVERRGLLWFDGWSVGFGGVSALTRETLLDEVVHDYARSLLLSQSG